MWFVCTWWNRLLGKNAGDASRLCLKLVFRFQRKKEEEDGRSKVIPSKLNGRKNEKKSRVLQKGKVEAKKSLVMTGIEPGSSCSDGRHSETVSSFDE